MCEVGGPSAIARDISGPTLCHSAIQAVLPYSRPSLGGLEGTRGLPSVSGAVEDVRARDAAEVEGLLSASLDAAAVSEGS